MLCSKHAHWTELTERRHLGIQVPMAHVKKQPSFSPSPDINRKIEESKNRSWVCPSPTFDFLTIIQTEIKKSKNRRIEESQIEVEVVTTDRRRSEFIYFSATVSNLLPPPPLLRLSSFHCVCEQITLLLRLLSPLKPSQTLT